MSSTLVGGSPRFWGEPFSPSENDVAPTDMHVIAQDENKYYWLITAPWIYLSGALIFSYLTYLNPNDFREYAMVRNLEWIPTLVLLAIGIAAWIDLAPANQS